jgi:uncharacterized protein YbjT (DUF2867 family)
MNILILGGSGFVGRAICSKLATAGHAVTVPTRKRDNARLLFPLPSVTVVETSVYDVAAITQLARGKDAIINLVGILNGDFTRAHVGVTETALAAAKAAGVPRFVQMSALGASDNGPSHYQRSKAAADALVRASGLDFTLFAPSVIFGRGDSFLTKFASMVHLLPPMMPMMLPGANARFQPVWVDDVARAFVACLRDTSTYGQRYELVGPTVYTLRELVAYVMQLAHDKHAIVGLPGFATRLLAAVLQYVPTQPLTPDNVASMSVANVSDAKFPAFAGTATALEDIAPGYLGRAAAADELAAAREKAGH